MGIKLLPLGEKLGRPRDRDKPRGRLVPDPGGVPPEPVKSPAELVELTKQAIEAAAVIRSLSTRP